MHLHRHCLKADEIGPNRGGALNQIPWWDQPKVGQQKQKKEGKTYANKRLNHIRVKPKRSVYSDMPQRVETGGKKDPIRRGR